MAAATTTTTPMTMATTAPSTTPLPATNTGGEASSSAEVQDPAAAFHMPSMATAGLAPEPGTKVPADEHIVEEEDNQAERSCYWLPSCVTEEHLAELVEGGFLPTKAECAWRAPGDETEPAPQGDERVILLSTFLGA